jgi:N6-L-threonylcarbamoyladenine synthase
MFIFMYSKVARRLSLTKHPRCSGLSGGQALELLARDGDRSKFPFKTPMGQHYDCNFSFAGLRNQVNMVIKKQEQVEGERRLEMWKAFKNVRILKIYESQSQVLLQIGKHANMSI